MKIIPAFVLAALIPFAIGAQMMPGRPGDRSAERPGAWPADRSAFILQQLALTDAQISQVQSIIQTAEKTIRDDRIQVRLIKAQIDAAILPSTAKPDMAAIGKLVDQQSQLRGDMEKALLSAKIQLIQIMGRDNFEKYSRALLSRLGAGKTLKAHKFAGMRAMNHGNMMGAQPFGMPGNQPPPADGSRK
ncbi:MAG: Spy/CpxP family protein refolding chaperone [Rectinemataceae bacterium]